MLGVLLLEYFLGLWWADYLATAIILAFVAREAVESSTNFTNKNDPVPIQCRERLIPITQQVAGEESYPFSFRIGFKTVSPSRGDCIKIVSPNTFPQ